MYVSNFSSPQPTKRYGTGQKDNRLYFLWQGSGRKASDLALLKKAGVEVGENVVLQFYPPGVEERLARLEMSYRGRQPSEIRVTRFQVVPAGNRLRFQGHRARSASVGARVRGQGSVDPPPGDPSTRPEASRTVRASPGPLTPSP